MMDVADPTPPVSDDDFPEFAEPPRFAPSTPGPGRAGAKSEQGSGEQQTVDAVIERLRKERREGKR